MNSAAPRAPADAGGSRSHIRDEGVVFGNRRGIYWRLRQRIPALPVDSSLPVEGSRCFDHAS
jgi:hypothetical protein